MSKFRYIMGSAITAELAIAAVSVRYRLWWAAGMSIAIAMAWALMLARDVMKRGGL